MSGPQQDDLKRQAGERAADLVQDGMVVGLGHGSTAVHAIRKIARLIGDGVLHDVRGIPCSRQVEQEARALGIPLTTLDAHPVIDLTIDGADEVDPDFNVIKGGGGALLREKIVAQASRREIIVVDASKLSVRLGTRFDVPIEIIPFACAPVTGRLAGLGFSPVLRRAGGAPFVSDQGNWILDCHTGSLPDLRQFAAAVEGIAGVVEHGLFTGLVTDVMVAGADGVVHRRRGPSPAA